MGVTDAKSYGIVKQFILNWIVLYRFDAHRLRHKGYEGIGRSDGIANNGQEYEDKDVHRHSLCEKHGDQRNGESE